MINYLVTPAPPETLNAKVYDKENGFYLEAVEQAPDFAALLDTIEDTLLDHINGEPGAVPVKDLALNLIQSVRLELLSELLLKLLVIFKDSDNLKFDIECLISAAGLPITDKSDSAIAAEMGQSRQNFSARKKNLMKRLGLSPVLNSKTNKACAEYQLTNRKNTTLN